MQESFRRTICYGQCRRGMDSRQRNTRRRCVTLYEFTPRVVVFCLVIAIYSSFQKSDHAHFVHRTRLALQSRDQGRILESHNPAAVTGIEEEVFPRRQQGALSRRGLNPIKLAYDPRQSDGRPHNGQRL